MLDDVLFKGNVQVVRVDSKMFNKRVGWDSISHELFSQLGFRERHGKLQLPDWRPEAPDGRLNRLKLMRAWIEIGTLLLMAKSNCTLGLAVGFHIPH